MRACARVCVYKPAPRDIAICDSFMQTDMDFSNTLMEDLVMY